MQFPVKNFGIWTSHYNYRGMFSLATISKVVIQKEKCQEVSCKTYCNTTTAWYSRPRSSWKVKRQKCACSSIGISYAARLSLLHTHDCVRSRSLQHLKVTWIIVKSIGMGAKVVAEQVDECTYHEHCWGYRWCGRCSIPLEVLPVKWAWLLWT